MKLANTPTHQIRAAAAAWRANARNTERRRLASGILGWLLPKPNMEIYDRVDDLVNEIDRLRITQMTRDDAGVFARHPRPWRLHPEYPRPAFDSDEDGVILDANDDRVLWSSEWFGAHKGVLDLIVTTVNKAQ